MHAYWGRGFEILDNHHIHSFLHLPFKQEAVLYGNLGPGLGIRSTFDFQLYYVHAGDF